MSAYIKGCVYIKLKHTSKCQYGLITLSIVSLKLVHIAFLSAFKNGCVSVLCAHACVSTCMHDSLHLCVCVCVSVCVHVCVYSLHSSCPLSVSKPVRWASQCTGGDRLAPNESIWDCLGEVCVLLRLCLWQCKCVFSQWVCVCCIYWCSHCVHRCFRRKTLLYVRKNNPSCDSS